MTWTIELTRQARKDLKAVRDRRLRQRLTTAMYALTEDQTPIGALRVKGYLETYRIRVGDWRICYRIEDDRVVIVVVTIAPRGEVCKRLGRREG